MFYFILFILFHFILFYFILFYFVLFFILFYFVLFCFILFYFVLFCFILFCFVCFITLFIKPPPFFFLPQVVKELLETEKNYVVSLGTIKMFFMPALEIYLNQKHTQFTRQHYQTLFGNLNEISNLASSLQKVLFVFYCCWRCGCGFIMLLIF